MILEPTYGGAAAGYRAAVDPVPEDWQRGLAIVAHPDDLEFGAAAAIARWTSTGKTVIEVLVTRGEAGIESMEPERTARVRSDEQLAAARIVGVETVEFLDHRDGVIEYGLTLRRDLARAVRRHRPEVVISLNFRETWPGGTGFNVADHRTVGLAVVDSIRDAANPWVFPDLAAEGAPAWQGVRFALFSHSPAARHFVDVTGRLDTGIASLEAHRVYLDNLPGDFDAASFLRSNAEDVGKQVGVTHAVPFELIEP
jgi:LmbE family N-acetylglucosaminyl deacetylase